jgi:two-component system, cell cycle response regulator
MSGPATTLTVLVADPDPVQQQRIVECLRPRYRVVTARNLAETVEMIALYHPQILLLEVDQPDGDGVRLIKQIRDERAARAMIVACVTKRSGIKDKVAGFQAGADDYIVKPVNTQTFLWRVVLLSRLRQLSS